MTALPNEFDVSSHLVIDPITSDDLNLFGVTGSSAGAGATAGPVAGKDEPAELNLFSFCNKCRTAGGAGVLRRRMQAPWSVAEKIRDTQQALGFIDKNLAAFAELPQLFVTGNTDEYTRDSLPIIKDEGTFEFASAAFSLWADEDRFYIRITKGVNLSCRLIQALRRFLNLLDDHKSAGELTTLIDDLQNLLTQTRLADVPAENAVKKNDRWFWQTLRLDQLFRLHEAESLRVLLKIIYEIDALVSLAEVTREHGFVKPKIESGETSIKAHKLVHPYVPDPVSNPVDLSQHGRVLFLTGPNMAGKTTYLRAVATALYMAHLGMGVPAAEFSFVPVQQLLTAIAMSDDLNDGVSYFRAEALRVKAVAKAVADGNRVVAIMDEPFKGTNVKDAFDASLAILQRFSTKKDCLFMVSSHLIELSDELDDSLSINYQYFEAEESAQRLRFDYVLHPGVSNQRLGMRVLREEGIFDLLDGEPTVR